MLAPSARFGNAGARLLDQQVALPGNLAKVRILMELARLVDHRYEPLSVLDVGCVGPTPFNQWHAFFECFPGRVQLTGIDVLDLERAAEVARQHGWPVELRAASAYTMARELGGRTFEVVVSTQVLEHLRTPELFFEQTAAVLAKGGSAYLTLDSAHYTKERTAKEWLRDVLAPAIGERYHDVGLSAERVRELAEGAGLAVVELRYYNIVALKHLHNHQLPPSDRNTFLWSWYLFEDTLNDDPDFMARNRSLFAGIYLKLRHR